MEILLIIIGGLVASLFGIVCFWLGYRVGLVNGFEDGFDAKYFKWDKKEKTKGDF